MNTDPAWITRLAAALVDGTPPPAPDAARLAAGLRAWMEDETPLSTALGVARSACRRGCRDAALKRAHAMLPGSTPWGRTRQLADEISRFETLHWPRWQGLPAPPPGTSALRAALFEARRFGPLPRLRQLHVICG